MAAGGLAAGAHDLAAQLAVRGSVLAGPSAARSWSMPISDRRIVLLVPPRCSARAEGVVLMHGRLGPRDVALLDGARATQRARTVFDCLRLLDDQRAEAFLDEAPRQSWVTLDTLADQARRNLGARGMPRLRRLLREAAGGERSVAERRLTALLKKNGNAD